MGEKIKLRYKFNEYSIKIKKKIIIKSHQLSVREIVNSKI
jgi:hypothetical protein